LDFLEAQQASAAIELHKGRRGLEAVAYARDPGAFPSGRVARDLGPRVVVRGVESRFATESSADLARALAYGLVFILYFAIVFNGQAIMSAVAEEKTSRVAELLVAMIPPSVLLSGKILATGAAGLIQVGLWGATAILLAPPSLRPAFGLAGGLLGGVLSPGEIAAFVAFFAIGYFQYAILFAAVASLISRTEDLGSMSGPLMILPVGAFLISQYTLIAPDSTTSQIASLVPLVSPFVMFTRLVVAAVPAWQVVLSVALNLAALVAIVPLAGKLYRVGMVLYGRAPKLSQIVAVLRS
jgi:ABC-2 type transport system permease protein